MQRNSPPTPSAEPQTELQNGFQDEWSELAEIAGYVPEAPPGKPKLRSPLSKGNDSKPAEQVDDSNQETQQPASLLDDEDLQEIEESTSRTKTPLWSDPFAKGAFVSTIMAIAVGSVGLFLWGINGNWNQQTQKPQASSTIAQETPSVDSQAAEISRLKTIAALGTQAQTLQQKANQPSRLPIPASISKPAPLKPLRPVPVVENFTSSPPVSYVPPHSYTPLATQLSPASTHNLISSVSQAPVDPTQAWQQALAAGSYGQVSNNFPSSRSQSVSQEMTEQRPSTSTADGASPSVQSASSQQTRFDADVNAILSGVPNRAVSVVPGTMAAATLSTPVIWAQDLKESQQPQRFGLKLTQPLLAGNGSVALPSGTEMVAKVNTISDSGMVELAIVAVVVPSPTGNELLNIPNGAILIAGEGGKPLMAENYNHDRHRIASMDAQVAVMGALGQVGTLLNRPANESTTTSPYLSSTSITNGRTNVFGGLLQGGFNALLGQVQQRQQQEIRTILQRPNVWYIPAGQTVQVFVNSSFQVSR